MTPTGPTDAQPHLVFLPDLGNHEIVTLLFSGPQSPGSMLGPAVLLFASGRLKGRVEDSGGLNWEPVFQARVWQLI